MRDFRQIVLGLCSLVLVFTGVLGRGYVLCIADDGVIRVESAGKDGLCAPRECKYGLEPADACNGCEDVGFPEGLARLSNGSLDSLLATPSMLGPSLHVSSSASWWDLEHTVLHLHPHPPFDTSLSSDLCAIRETVILLI
jgi:hypothetical protein